MGVTSERIKLRAQHVKCSRAMVSVPEPVLLLCWAGAKHAKAIGLVLTYGLRVGRAARPVGGSPGLGAVTVARASCFLSSVCMIMHVYASCSHAVQAWLATKVSLRWLESTSTARRLTFVTSSIIMRVSTCRRKNCLTTPKVSKSSRKCKRPVIRL